MTVTGLQGTGVKPRVAVLIDGAAMNRICRALQARVDYRRLRAVFAEREMLTQICYYAVTPPAHENFPHRTLLDWLVYNGYTVREKIGREVVTRDGQRYLKGSQAVEIAVDAMEMATTVQHLVLVPGDDDFKALADALQRKGVRFSILSTLRGDTKIVSNRLRRCADEFLDFADMLPSIEISGGNRS